MDHSVKSCGMEPERSKTVMTKSVMNSTRRIASESTKMSAKEGKTTDLHEKQSANKNAKWTIDDEFVIKHIRVFMFGSYFLTTIVTIVLVFYINHLNNGLLRADPYER